MTDKLALINNLDVVLGMLRHTGEYEKAIEYLESELISINKLVNFYVNAVYEYDEEDKIIVDRTIKVLQEIYNNTDIISPISDENYDKLYEVNRKINDEDIVGASVGAGERVTSAHKYPDLRGTLDKIHFITNLEKKPGEKRKSLEDWTSSTMNRLVNRPHDNPDILLFPKWDGISAIFECDENGKVKKVLKRGDTTRNEAEEMTHMFTKVTFPPDEYLKGNVSTEFGIKTEIVMSRENYDKLCAKYGHFKSPRSAVSSIINSKEFDEKYLPYLTVIPLQVQRFDTKEIDIPLATFHFPYKTSQLFSVGKISAAIIDIVDEVKGRYGIDIDGIVIRLANKELQKSLGREDNINKYDVAYKLPPEQTMTVLNDVEMSVGVLGAITPVAKIEPVKLKGNTISNISLGSIDRFETLGLRKGDEVIIKYDVIPYLDVDDTCRKGDGELFVTPKTCPYCGKDLVKQPVLRCINDDCESRMIGKVMNYVTKMSIPNISIGIITTLYKEGYLKSVEDLYTLENQGKHIVLLDGFGKKSFQKIIDGIKSRHTVYDYELIGSLGIPDIGRKMFKKILSKYNLETLIKLCADNDVSAFTKLPGIKEKTAEKIIKGVNSNYQLIKYLTNILDVKADNREYKLKVAFTGVRDKDFAKFLDSVNVYATDSYNKEIDILIVKDKQSTSSKITKAIKDGKEIITIDEAYINFGYNK